MVASKLFPALNSHSRCVENLWWCDFCKRPFVKGVFQFWGKWLTWRLKPRLQLQSRPSPTRFQSAKADFVIVAVNSFAMPPNWNTPFVKYKLGSCVWWGIILSVRQHISPAYSSFFACWHDKCRIRSYSNCIVIIQRIVIFTGEMRRNVYHAKKVFR